MQIVMFVGSILLIVCLGLGIISYVTSSNALIDNARETMPRVAVEASKIVELGLLANLNELEAVAANKAIVNMEDITNNNADIKALMNSEVKRSGHLRMAVIDKNGVALYNDGAVEDNKDADYFKKAMGDAKVVTDPAKSSTKGSIIITYAVPIKAGDEILGVLKAERDGYELSNLVGEIKYGEFGRAFLVNQQGNTIAHADKQVVSSILSNIESSAVDATSSATVSEDSAIDSRFGFGNFSVLKQQMVDGKTDFGEYEYNGSAKYMGFAPVAGYGWSVALEIDKNEVLAGLDALKIRFAAMSLIFLLIGFLAAFIIAAKIDKPIAYLTRECNEIAKGDFTLIIKENYIKRQDEIGGLSKAFQKITGSLRELIKNSANISKQVAASAQELTATIQHSSTATEEIARTIEEISKGAVKQAEEAEQGTIKVNDISMLIEKEHGHMKELNKSIDEVDNLKEEGFQILSELVEKTEDSNKASNEIYNIIIDTNESAAKIQNASHMIRNIAEQTNILALNAAIEAARAGESGKGFAVVSEEIRKMADESNKFSKEIMLVIKELIEKTSCAVNTIQEASRITESQTESVEMTKVKFEGIAAAIENTKNVMDILYQSVREIEIKKEEVVDIIHSLSAVSEQNAAGTEEVTSSVEEQTSSLENISEASEALARLAEEMNQNIVQFKY